MVSPWLCLQVVTLAVYIYFLTALIGDQTLVDRPEVSSSTAHVWFPVFTRQRGNCLLAKLTSFDMFNSKAHVGCFLKV